MQGSTDRTQIRLHATWPPSCDSYSVNLTAALSVPILTGHLRHAEGHAHQSVDVGSPSLNQDHGHRQRGEDTADLAPAHLDSI